MNISKEFLESNLKLPLKTVILKETDSTNTVCKKLSQNTEEDIAVIALSQSAGKGRLGRSFFSPENSGIYMSILLHPDICAKDCVKITTAAAVAAANSIDSVSGRHSLIKWVNDIYCDGKKVCGILTEASFSAGKSTPDYAVLGIGFNICEPESGFPDDIKEKAGSIFSKESASEEKAARIITEFTENFLGIYESLSKSGYMEEYRSRSMFTGKEVYFTRDGKEICGTVLGIGDNAELILKTADGTLSLMAGEVSLRAK